MVLASRGEYINVYIMGEQGRADLVVSVQGPAVRARPRAKARARARARARAKAMARARARARRPGRLGAGSGA